MLILYVGMKYDYGRPERGFSPEHGYAFDTLRLMGHDILYFDFMTLLQNLGRRKLNCRLAEVAVAERPTLLFSVLYQEQIDKRTIRRISDSGNTLTFNWFADDHWRFDIFSRYWAPCYNFVSTTAREALPKYDAIGYRNVIKSQWAVNPFTYRRLDLPLQHDIAFVGQPHGRRREAISALQSSGLNVACWGQGWPNGRLTEPDMIKVFSTSRMNLNFAASSVPAPSRAQRLEAALTHQLLRVPLGYPIKRLIGESRKLIGRARGPSRQSPETHAEGSSAPPQIKGRVFEVAGCGGLLLTDYCDDLESYYDLNKEIICFTGLDDLQEKIRYYLAHEDQRAAIAAAGYRRTLREHTYVHRFNEIFARMSLPHAPPTDSPQIPLHPPGQVVEIT